MATVSESAAPAGHSRRALRELLGMLVGPLPGLPVPELLVDRQPGPGLFGRESQTWLLSREPVLMLAGSRALLMQVAHPLIAQAVVDHSDYATRPYDRLLATMRWLTLVTFGTTAEADAAIDRLYAVHRGVTGALTGSNASGPLPAGTRYAANDPALGRWVLAATIVESTLAGYEALVAPLSVAASDRFVQESQVLGARLGIPPAALWSSASALRAYVAGELAAGTVTVVPASRLAARVVLRPCLPWPGLGPLSELLAFITAGLLPAPLRRQYGIAWTPGRQRAHAALCATLRGLYAVLPRRLRRTPMYDVACRRSQAGGAAAAPSA